MAADGRRAVLLDPHPLWLEALMPIVERSGVAIAATATAPSVALTAVDRERPDLFITSIDTGDPELDGLACVRRARESVEDLQVIVTGDRAEPSVARRAFDAGAAAFVAKTADADDLALAVRQAFTRSILFAFEPESGTGDDPAEALTPRELEILRLVAQGDSNSRIGRHLWITEQTVKFHLSNIYRKLGVANRMEAARWGYARRVLDAER